MAPSPIPHPPYHLMTNQHPYQGDYPGDDYEPTSSAASVFNFGFDTNPYLDEDFGILARQQRQLQAEANARAHALSVTIVEPAERTKKDARETFSSKKAKSKLARFPKCVWRVPVPRYEGSPATRSTTHAH